MEIGSKEHKKLLIKGIVRTAVRTLSIGLGIGLFLIFPSLIRENSFSHGLAVAGQVIVAISLVYTLVVGFKKYRQTLAKL